jgi:type I restriction enzyme R subunit
MSPEARARQIIDKKLTASGWILQDYKGEFNPAASLGVAVREFPTASGHADYMLFVDKIPLGVVEAKETEEGQNITTAETQTLRYANSSLKWQAPGHSIRFVYEVTDILTRFTDYSDDDERSREVFSFHRPETLLALSKEKSTLRNRLKIFPEFDNKGFRDCQTTAINNLALKGGVLNPFGTNKKS